MGSNAAGWCLPSGVEIRWALRLFFLLFSLSARILENYEDNKIRKREKIGGNLPLLGWIGPLCCVAFDTLNTIMHISNNNYTILYLLAVSAYPCFWKMLYQHIAVSVSTYPYHVSVQRRRP
jgi:hypothetical protein